MDATYSTHTRRSHPSLQHFSLAPLTPSTALHSPPPPLSTSYLSPSPLPSAPSSILSPSHSLTQLRLTAALPLSRSTPALPRPSRHPRHHQHPSARALPSAPVRRPSGCSLTARDLDDGHDWLVRTASALTSSSLEQKGHVWLATRRSSTELADDEYNPDSSPEWARSRAASSRFASPVRLRSRMQSRRGSSGGAGGDRALREDFVEPDFVEREDEDGDGDGEDGDGEGEVDEGEMRRIVMGRVGGWVDWAVGWMDFRADGDDEDEDADADGDGDGKGRNHERVGVLQKGNGNREHKSSGGVAESKNVERAGNVLSGVIVEGGRSGKVPSVEVGGDGVWTDAKWLLGVAGKSIV